MPLSNIQINPININGLFIGTVHSYAYNLLCAGGYFEEARKYADEEKFDDYKNTLEKMSKEDKEMYNMRNYDNRFLSHPFISPF